MLTVSISNQHNTTKEKINLKIILRHTQARKRVREKLKTILDTCQHDAALEDANVTPKQEPLDIPVKKTKLEEAPMSYSLKELYNNAFLYQISQISHISRQQPWLTGTSPKHIIPPFGQNLTSIHYLPASQEPPVLQNPERVVRHSESERFERTYQPNVALAPRHTVLTKERERERDFDKDRESNEHTNSVIKCEIQIKQERPSTPSNESPELRNNSPETSGVVETNGVATVPPISPEGQSGSNEITSSTSPVPANIPNKQESMSPPPSMQASPSLTSPRSHLLSHTIRKTSPVVVKVTTNQSSSLVNGIKKLPILGNPEFELSTDTDEESLGEPDSSNLNGSLSQSPFEFAKVLLKNNSLEDREKVLNLIKYMENEITQLKESHKKEIREMKQQQHQREEDFRKTIESMQCQFSHQNNRSNMNSSTVIATCLSSSSSSSSSSLSSSSSYDYDRSERRNSIVEKPNVIIKPLKKSLRITPILDDCKPVANITSTPSIVIMPKREDIMNNNNTKHYNNNNNATIVNGNGQTEPLDESLKKTVIKAEKL
ncbi:CLUMA_CG013788, isoform A [Clunio marinus]|uniref:CLUMA_CG013788, isoform A n=1 Tax=Clunio marinus TaxID=568069 RepID=A0A1J1IJW1_9DIPT|nr:CLUMA_CG013788, isoform A [Clunio marinus]